MKFLISPAKTLDLTSKPIVESVSQPARLDDAQPLIESIKPSTPADIASLMKLSDKHASLNVSRYQEWQKTHSQDNSRPAIYTFMGDVYTGLDAYSLSEEDMLYAQKSLRILSGLYGVLKPLDLMQAYRLEMGTKLSNQRGSNLYQFWGDRIVDKINEDLQENEILVNLSSNEYFKAVNTKKLKAPLVSPNFLDEKSGKFKVISFYAKKARGLMARYLIENRCETLEDLKAFDLAGYRYDPQQSTKDVPVFIRPESAQPQK